MAAVLATGLAAVLVFVQPFVGRRRYKKLLDRIERDPGARLHHYRRGITGEWFGVGSGHEPKRFLRLSAVVKAEVARARSGKADFV